jgi:hypothetical protein
LWLTLAHQFISPLDEEVRDAVLGNSSTIVSFRVGAKDAPLIAEALDCAPQTLLDQGSGQARVRTLDSEGRPTEAREMRTTLTKLPVGYLTGNVRQTRAAYARPRATVERMLGGGGRTDRRKW